MSLTAATHLNFDGQAREALEFYAGVGGGQATVATYADFGMPAEVPGSDRVVFGQVVAASGFAVMAYDVPATGAGGPEHRPSTRRENHTTVTAEPFFLAVRGSTVDEASALFAGLTDGGTVVEAFGPAPWAPGFGMVTDRYGVTWIVDVAAEHG